MKIAVYGTLKKDKGNDYLLEDSEFLGNDKIKGTMYHLGGFPAMVLDGEDEIDCEIYEIDDTTLSRLDILEGYPILYNRTTVTTLNGVECLVYYMVDEDNLKGQKKITKW